MALRIVACPDPDDARRGGGRDQSASHLVPTIQIVSCGVDIAPHLRFAIPHSKDKATSWDLQAKTARTAPNPISRVSGSVTAIGHPFGSGSRNR